MIGLFYTVKLQTHRIGMQEVYLKDRVMAMKSIMLGLLLWTGVALAEEGDAAGQVEYVEVNPEIVTNIGDKGRLRYLRVKVTLRVSRPGSAEAVHYHMPFVRDRLIRILGDQDPDRALDPEIKQTVRATALAELNAFFSGLDGAQVDDLLFTEYLIQ